MSEYIGSIPIPAQTPSGTFPITPDYKAVRVYAPQIAVHRFGHGDAAAEQRFILGDGAIRWSLPFSHLSPARKTSLVNFYDGQTVIIPFTLNLPMPDGTTTSVVVRFDGPLSITQTSANSYSATVNVVEVPQTAPTYSISQTLTRFPDAGTLTQLLNSTQEVIPVLVLNGNVYLSNRRMTLGGQLYQPRISDWSDISQSIDGSADQFQVTLGNADRVMSLYSRSVNLYGAQIQFSLYIVGNTTLLNLWAGEVNDFSGGASDKFTISAGDPLWDLRKNYPVVTIDRDNPQFQVPDQPVICHSNNNRITSTSIGSDSAYGQPLQDVWINDQYHPLPVPCTIISGRDESQYYAALGIVGRGPISGFYDQTDQPHTLDGQTWIGVGHTSNPNNGLRRSFGGTYATGDESAAADSPDHGSEYFALDNNSMTWPNWSYPIDGVSFLQIRRSDASGIQPVLPSNHVMIAQINAGLGGWTWTAAGSKYWAAAITNPIWIAVNTHLRWVSAGKAGSAPGGLSINLASSYWYYNASAAQMEAYFDVVKAIADASICSMSVTPLFARTTIQHLPDVGGPPTGYPLPANWITGSGPPSGTPALDGTVYIDTSTNYLWVWPGQGGWQLKGVYTPPDATTQYSTPATGVDVTVPVTSEAQFTCQGVVGGGSDGAARPLRDWLRDILGSACGYFNFNFGKLRTGLRYNASVTDAFTIGNTLYGSYVESSRKPAFSRLELSFSDADYQYKNNPLSYEDKDIIATQGRKVGKANAFGVTNKSQAARVCTVRAREEMGGIGTSDYAGARIHQLQSTVLALSVEPGSVISYTGPETNSETVKFRCTKWVLHKDFSLTIQGNTVTDTMYDLTTGPKPSDVPPASIPERPFQQITPQNVLPIGGQPFTYSETNDGAALILTGQYCPPLPVSNFRGVSIYVDTPAHSGNYIHMGDRDYDGNATATDSTVLADWACRIPLTSSGNTISLATTVAIGSGNVLTFTSTTDANGNAVQKYMAVTGTNIPTGTYVASLDATTVTLSNPVAGLVALGSSIGFQSQWTVYLVSRTGAAARPLVDPTSTPNVTISSVALGTIQTNIPVAPQVSGLALNTAAPFTNGVQFSRDASGNLIYQLSATWTAQSDPLWYGEGIITQTSGNSPDPISKVPVASPLPTQWVGPWTPYISSTSVTITAQGLNSLGIPNASGAPSVTAMVTSASPALAATGVSCKIVWNATQWSWNVTAAFPVDANRDYIWVQLQTYSNADHASNHIIQSWTGIGYFEPGAGTSTFSQVAGWQPWAGIEYADIRIACYTPEGLVTYSSVANADVAGVSGVAPSAVSAFTVSLEIEGSQAQGGGVFSIAPSGALVYGGASSHNIGDSNVGFQSARFTVTFSIPTDLNIKGVYIVASQWDSAYTTIRPNGPWNNGWVPFTSELQPPFNQTCTLYSSWNKLPTTADYEEITAWTFNWDSPPIITTASSGFVQKVLVPAAYGLQITTGGGTGSINPTNIYFSNANCKMQLDANQIFFQSNAGGGNTPTSMMNAGGAFFSYDWDSINGVPSGPGISVTSSGIIHSTSWNTSGQPTGSYLQLQAGAIVLQNIIAGTPNRYPTTFMGASWCSFSYDWDATHGVLKGSGIKLDAAYGITLAGSWSTAGVPTGAYVTLSPTVLSFQSATSNKVQVDGNGILLQGSFSGALPSLYIDAGATFVSADWDTVNNVPSGMGISVSSSGIIHSTAWSSGGVPTGSYFQLQSNAMVMQAIIAGSPNRYPTTFIGPSWCSFSYDWDKTNSVLKGSGIKLDSAYGVTLSGSWNTSGNPTGAYATFSPTALTLYSATSNKVQIDANGVLVQADISGVYPTFYANAGGVTVAQDWDFTHGVPNGAGINVNSGGIIHSTSWNSSGQPNGSYFQLQAGAMISQTIVVGSPDTYPTTYLWSGGCVMSADWDKSNGVQKGSAIIISGAAITMAQAWDTVGNPVGAAVATFSPYQMQLGYGLNQLVATPQGINVGAYTATLTTNGPTTATNSTLYFADLHVAIATNASASSGSTVLSFASTAGIKIGYRVYNSARIQTGTVVIDMTAATVTLSLPTSGGTLSSGTSLYFHPLTVGMAVKGTYIPTGTVISSFSGNNVVISNPVTGGTVASLAPIVFTLAGAGYMTIDGSGLNLINGSYTLNVAAIGITMGYGNTALQITSTGMAFGLSNNAAQVQIAGGLLQMWGSGSAASGNDWISLGQEAIQMRAGTQQQQGHDGYHTLLLSSDGIAITRNYYLGATPIQTTIFAISASTGITLNSSSWRIALSAAKTGANSDITVLNALSLPTYANNAAAIAGGLVAGNSYRTGGDPDVQCIVH